MTGYNKEKVIKDAQYRKGLSIAFFNATNIAIEVVKSDSTIEPQNMLGKIVEVRDWFLKEHEKYYAEVVAQIGVNYDVKEAVKKLKAVKTLSPLSIGFSPSSIPTVSL